jgi:GH15 family glucan-1,4-alpha-glucosidase
MPHPGRHGVGAGPLTAPMIDAYGLIGDCRSAALVSREGSIDWLCWPRFDSPACFAALLGTPAHGRWLIAPQGQARVSRGYRGETMVLETVFATEAGEVALVDFMPIDGAPGALVRVVEGRRGRVAMAMELVLRFDYGQAVPWVTRLPDGGGIQAVAGPDLVVLRSPVRLEGRGLTTVADFTVAAGETLAFSMAHGPSHAGPPAPRDPAFALEETLQFWRRWGAQGREAGVHAGLVRRSLLTLKALSDAETGGMVAAPTTSLPEQPGGTRNWDYRFCWLRDASLALRAFMQSGHFDEARAWRDWLHRSVAGSPRQMQVMYGVAGERRLAEWEVDWLPGHGGARPVRVGNGAAGQMQHDVFGHVTMALLEAREGGLAASADSWNLQVKLMEYLEQVWHLPDEGIWEVRGGRRHFTFSKVMAWVAMDRSIRAAERFGLEAPLERWRALRARIHAAVCAQGVDARRGCFVQSFGDTVLDASLLQIPLVGFLPVDDPRVAATVAAIEAELMPQGLVLRYDTRQVADGLPPGEGAFLACSFWLVEVMALQGRRAGAEALFARLAGLCNDLGLMAEMHDPASGLVLGNFPQAFSHAALIAAAARLAEVTPG